jgi:hypothetical protein
VCAAVAHAAETKKLAIHVEGKNASTIRDHISAAAPAGVEIVDNIEFDKAMRATGLPPLLAGAIQNKGARKLLVKSLNKAMDKTRVDAVVLARELILGKKREIGVVYFVKGADDARVDTKIDPGQSDSSQRKAIQSALGDTLRELAPAPEPEVPAEKSDEEKQKEQEVEDAKRKKFVPNVPGGEVFNVRVGLEDGGRFFRYSDSITETVNRDYKIFGPPAIAVAAEVYPAATTGIVVVRDIGLWVDYAHYFAVRSQTSDNLGFGANWNRLNTGLRYRFRFGAKERPFVLALQGGYGFHNFAFKPDDDKAARITDSLATVKYNYLRVGLDARLPVSIVAFLPGFSYLGPLSPSDDTVYARFRDASVKGVQMWLDLAVVLPKGFELRGGAEYTRYFASFRPEPGDAYVAGGALDQFVALRLSALYRY